MKRVFCVAALAAAALAGPVSAQQLTDNTVKLGVLTDMSSLYSDINGPGAVIAVADGDRRFRRLGLRQEDRAGPGRRPEQGRRRRHRSPAAGTTPSKVDVILGTGASSSSIATSGVAGDKKKIYLATDPASSDITGKLCNPYTVHWVYDTVALANGTGSAVVKAGGKSWFFLTADYAFGYALQRDVAERRHQERRQGAGRGPRTRSTPTTSRRSCCRPRPPRRRSSASPMPAATRSTRSSRRRSSASSRAARSSPACWSSSSDVHSLGLERAQGLNLTEAFYWDLNDKTRAFAKRFGAEAQRQDADQHPGRLLFGGAAATSNAVKAAGTDDADKVMAKLKEIQWDDPIFGKSYIRAGRPQDARHVPVRGQEAVGVQRPLRLL